MGILPRIPHVHGLDSGQRRPMAPRGIGVPEGGEIIDDLDHYVDGMLEDKNGNTSMFVDTDVDLGLDLTIDEPSTWALLALGFVGLAATGRGRRST